MRALGVALPYAIAQAIFGGNAETAALCFKRSGHETGYYWVVASIMAVAFLVAAGMRDTRKHGLIRED